MLILGIDDAGRGPIIGPMVLAGVLLTSEQQKLLRKSGVRDSKELSQYQRERLSNVIRKNSKGFSVIKVHPEEIDHSLNSRVNLNTLEAQKTAEIINTLNKGRQEIRVFIDCPSVNIEKWQSVLESFVNHRENLKIACEHKADANHVSAAAASVLAKTAREEEVAKIKNQFGKIGSGYPSDPTTKDFLKKYGKVLSNSGIFRKTWQTWKNLFPEQVTDKKQRKISDFK